MNNYETLEVIHQKGRDIYTGKTKFAVDDNLTLKVISEGRTVAIYPKGNYYIARPVEVPYTDPAAA